MARVVIVGRVRARVIVVASVCVCVSHRLGIPFTWLSQTEACNPSQRTCCATYGSCSSLDPPQRCCRHSQLHRRVNVTTACLGPSAKVATGRCLQQTVGEPKGLSMSCRKIGEEQQAMLVHPSCGAPNLFMQTVC